MHVAFVEILPEMNALVADLFDDLRQLQSFTGRPTLVRADVAVGIIFTFVKDDADLYRTCLHQTRPTIGNFARLANQNFRHGTSVQS